MIYFFLAWVALRILLAVLLWRYRSRIYAWFPWFERMEARMARAKAWAMRRMRRIVARR